MEETFFSKSSMTCCLHACLALECPETICALDFPGYSKAFDRFKKVKDLIRSGATPSVVAEELQISLRAAQRLCHKIAALGVGS